MSGQIIHGGGVTAASQLYGGKPEDWLDLSTGINPCPVSVPDVPLNAWHRLPDAWLMEQARSAASQFYNCPGILPLPVPGTQSAIQLLPRLVQGGRVAIFSPTYGEYAKAFLASGFHVDAVSNIAEIAPEHRAVVIVNPNNPTGHLFSRVELLTLQDRLTKQNCLLIVDEAFGDLQPEHSVANDAGKREGLIVFRSFGKFFGLAGLRLGFVIAKPDVMDQMQDWLGPWAVSGPALSIAAQLMTHDVEPIRLSIARRSLGLQNVLSNAGLLIKGQADLFCLVQHDRALDLHEHLARSYILVRKFDYQRNWLRFGLTPNEASDQILAEALARFRS